MLPGKLQTTVLKLHRQNVVVLDLNQSINQNQLVPGLHLIKLA